jgi:chemotaxis protein CheY-P-specific phosphatase CheC
MIRASVALKTQRIYDAKHYAPIFPQVPMRDRLVVVSQRLKVRNQDAGRMLMIMSLDRALALSALIAGWNGPLDSDLHEADADAIKELANILLGRCLDALSEVITLKPKPSLPTLVQGPTGMITTSLRPSPNAICIETCLSTSTREVELTLLATLDCSLLRQATAGTGGNAEL